MTIGTLSISQPLHPAFHAVGSQHTQAPLVHQEERAVLPTGNHIGFLIDEQQMVTTRKPVTEASENVSADESVKWILDHPSADSFSDAVHSQLLKSFLLENGLAVASSTDEVVVDQKEQRRPVFRSEDGSGPA